MQYRQVLLDHLFDNGIMMINTASATLSTPMTEPRSTPSIEAMESGFRKLKAMA